MRRYRFVFLVTLIALLGSCSGGGGGADTYESWWQFPKDVPIEKDAPGPDVEAVGEELRPDSDIVDEPGDHDVLSDGLPEIDDVPDVQLPDELAPDVEDIKQPDTDPGTYPFEAFGPLTVSAKGLIIAGKYLQMRFAEVSYWKFPASRWDALLDQVKEAGFNGVYTSACWRRHETTPGALDFSTGNLNLAAFLQKAQSRNLYIYFHAGPWIAGEAAGCLPDRIGPGGDAIPSPMADNKIAIRMTDADWQNSAAAWFDQVNAQVVPYQITSFPEGKLAFYQVESHYDLFYFLRDARNRVMQEMAGSMPVPLNPGLYMAQLRDAVQADGIKVPLVTSLTGDFENGGRRIAQTGDAPGIYPAFDLATDSPYQSMELKLWNLKKEMRNTALHGQVYMAVPGIAVGILPSPVHMARALMAGADVVVVRDFAASVLPPDASAVRDNATGLSVFSKLDKARPAVTPPRADPASPISLSGVPRRSFEAFRHLNLIFDRVGPMMANRDLPHRIGPNNSNPPLKLTVSLPSVGAIEDKYKAPAPGVAGGVTELFGDHFDEWFLSPSEPTGRATYFFDASDGTILVHLLNLDVLKEGKNLHSRYDLLTKITYAGATIPRHSSIVIPASDDQAGGEDALGWGQKFLLVNHPLGAGYPMMEYCSANLAAIREFNGRLLLVAYGKPLVNADGTFFTEPGEISFANFPGIPDIVHNSLPGGGLHTDPGGKLAVQFQHDSTGSLVVGFGGGKQVQILSTTLDVARSLHFELNSDATDIAALGLSKIDSVQPDGNGKLTVSGRVQPGVDRLVFLMTKAPDKVTVDGSTAACKWTDYANMLDCKLSGPVAGPPELIPHGDLYVRQEGYFGAPEDVGTAEFPDHFLVQAGVPVAMDALDQPATFGVGWYLTSVELGPVAPGQDGFLSVGGGADVLTFFVNGQYAGSAVALGNVPMSSGDTLSGTSEIGFRVPAGLFVQGTNQVAIRAFAFGRSPLSMFPLYSTAPILPPNLDSRSSKIPHFAVEGLDPAAHKGIWGPSKVVVGAVSAPLSGEWKTSRGNASGTGVTAGMLKGWHNLGPDAGAPANAGFSTTNPVGEATPLALQDGQMSWATFVFSKSALAPWEGTPEVVLEGKSALAVVFLNGQAVGVWASDEPALSQGLHSRLLQGAGTRQLLADLGFADFFTATRSRIPLPPELLQGDNRVTLMLLDISPPQQADLTLPSVGTVSGQGMLTRLDLAWNRDEPENGQPGAAGALVGKPMVIEFLPGL